MPTSKKAKLKTPKRKNAAPITHGELLPPKVLNPKQGFEPGHQIKANRDPERKKLRALSTGEVRETIEMLLDKNLIGLKKVIKDQRSSVLQLWIARIVERAVINGKTESLELLLNRCIGKVSDKVEHTGRDGGPINSTNVFLALTPEQRAKEIEELRQARLKLGQD